MTNDDTDESRCRETTPASGNRIIPEPIHCRHSEQPDSALLSVSASGEKDGRGSRLQLRYFFQNLKTQLELLSKEPLEMLDEFVLVSRKSH